MNDCSDALSYEFFEVVTGTLLWVRYSFHPESVFFGDAITTFYDCTIMVEDDR